LQWLHRESALQRVTPKRGRRVSSYLDLQGHCPSSHHLNWDMGCLLNPRPLQYGADLGFLQNTSLISPWVCEGVHENVSQNCGQIWTTKSGLEWQVY
jgi:hypothetical protein